MKNTVLIVDDDVVSRMVLMHLVDASGDTEVVEAEDGQDAWDQLSAGLRPAIVFCDLRMPRLSGMDLLQRVRGEPGLSDLPFVLVTSANDTETVTRAQDFGVTGYLVKPFQPDDVNTQLARLRAADENEAPMTIMQRLGVSRERLMVYVGGLQSQLQVAGGECETLLARGDDAGVRSRIERLELGCATLGLHGAVRALHALHEDTLSAARVRAALDVTARAVAQRSDEIRRIC